MSFSKVLLALVAVLFFVSANGRELRQATPTFASGIINTAANLVDGAIDFAEDVTDFFGTTPEIEDALDAARETNANNTATVTQFFSQLGK